MSEYERKVALILKFNLARFTEHPTADQIALERQVAVNILAQLGVVP
jgi:hypothetical protein